MTAKRILEINGDFHNSPLLDSLRRINKLFSEYSIPYAVIGGLAVVRNGAVRTTIDIDILTSKDGWSRIREAAPEEFKTGMDHAVDKKNGVDIDVIFSGNDWEMVIPLPRAEEIREYDKELEAWFIDLPHLIELKTAVFLKKKIEDGFEIAAKDMADITALMENNLQKMTRVFIQKIRPEVRDEVSNILNKVKKKIQG